MEEERRGGSENLNLAEIGLVGAQDFKTQERDIQTPGTKGKKRVWELCRGA